MNLDNVEAFAGIAGALLFTLSALVMLVAGNYGAAITCALLAIVNRLALIDWNMRHPR